MHRGTKDNSILVSVIVVRPNIVFVIGCILSRFGVLTIILESMYRVLNLNFKSKFFVCRLTAIILIGASHVTRVSL